MMRKAIRGLKENNADLELLLPHIRFNIGFIFTNGDLNDVKAILDDNRVEAPARAGAIAPVDVIVPAMLTGMEPGQTGFFQALNVPTKINKGQIEILSPLELFKA